MNRRVLFLLVPLVLMAVSQLRAESPNRPNIVFILCDDLGYGDVHCLAPETSKIPTPHADRLAADGMIFTDAHSGSSVCTPTRYGLMTGRYSWRTRLQKGVVTGFAQSLIAEDRPTVASFLQAHGYHTAVIGKWHLDFQYVDPGSGKALKRKQHKKPPVGAIIPDGPLTRGFDSFHGFHHARDMECVIEGNEVIEHDAVINMLPRLTSKAVEYIDSRANSDSPFFLYLPLGSPHTPIVPTKEWQGRSGLGDYGDFVMQTDHVVGQVCDALQRNNLAKNTLIIFSSDNGCSKAAGIPKLAEQGHLVSAHMRGSKADIWDGGHRVPFLAAWPGHIEAGSTCDQLICLVDFFATTAALLQTDPPAGSCEDSVSFLPAFAGETIRSDRNGVVHHSVSGHFAYRTGDWKLILARGSGGWSSPNEKQVPVGTPEGQLYDLDADSGEQDNLYKERPEVVAELMQLLTDDVLRGRSVPGADSENDVVNIELWKSGRGPKKKPAGKSK